MIAAVVDTSWNTGHFLTVIGGAIVIIGQWFVQGYRLNNLEKTAAENRGQIGTLKEQASKGPSLLCSIHEQRLTKLEEEMKLQYLNLKGDLETIIKMMNKHHS